MKTVPALLFAALLFLVPAAARSQPVETELAGVTAEVVELRQTGGVLRLAVRFANSGAKSEDFDHYAVGRIVLVDVKSKKKHFPLKDANGQFIGGPIGVWLDGGRIVLKVPQGRAAMLWAYFEPVAPGSVMTVEVPYVFPFENVPVTEGPGKVFASGTAGSTPGGVRATLVSATRADQVLNVRLRLAVEPGETADTLHNRFNPYFMFKDVFLFDPVAKRKYLLVKDTEGYFQAQPLTVKMDGGRFIHDWRKTTLVSLTFQAPPDTVQRVDLLLPQFLPFEAVTIEGLGGAAASGIEAAGTTLGLEGALKDLKAEVTATEIKIDLAADVLFDFDKAEIKKQAEPSLLNLATVLKANPGATVTIEGHTDAKGADAYNQTLSEQRAASVKQWLVANAQVNGATISTRGWGKSKPVTYNAKPDGSDDPEGRAKNRRVQIIVRKGAP
jgi:outer membrane protein OmpA-like peptidoglycan-associated protein